MFVQLIHFPSPQITKIFKKVKAEHEAKHLIPSERRALCAVLCHPHRSSPAWGITRNIRVHPGQSPLPSCSFHSTYRATMSARPAELRCCVVSPPLTVSSRFPCWFLQDKTSVHLPLKKCMPSNACLAWKSSCRTFKHPPLMGPSLHLPQALLPDFAGLQLDVFQRQEVWV